MTDNIKQRMATNKKNKQTDMQNIGELFRKILWNIEKLSYFNVTI